MGNPIPGKMAFIFKQGLADPSEYQYYALVVHDAFSEYKA